MLTFRSQGRRHRDMVRSRMQHCHHVRLRPLAQTPILPSIPELARVAPIIEVGPQQ